MNRYSYIPIFIVILAINSSFLFSQEKADESLISYEQAMTYLLTDDYESAKTYLEKSSSQKGEYSDLAVLELARLEGRLTGIERLRQIVEGISKKELTVRAWMYGIEGLEEGGKWKDAVDLSEEISLKFPESEIADEIILKGAVILIKKGKTTVALHRLYKILEKYPASRSADDACFLISDIYRKSGEHYSPGMETAMLKSFISQINTEHYRNSLWRREVEDRLIMKGALLAR